MTRVEDAFSKLRVLILEDNRAMRAILRSILNGLGCHDVIAYASMSEALADVERMTPDVVLCDYHLDQHDGIEFVRQLRASPNAGVQMTPVIMVTSYTDRKSIRAYINAGADEVLAKPVSPELVYTRIAAVINRRRPFVRTKGYFGPDRRRKEIPVGEEQERRSA